MEYLTNITPEMRKEMQEKARLSRIAKDEASDNIKKFVDERHWRELASSLGVRMPQSNCQADELKFVKRAAKKLNLDISVWVKEVVGAVSLIDVARMNPDAGAVGIMGYFLEWASEVKGLDNKS